MTWVQTVIKNLAGPAQVNDALSSGDQVVLWREASTGNLYIRLDTGVDVPITFAGATVLVGGLDPTGNIDYPAATIGEWWFFTADGTIGAPPIDVNEGDTLTCITTTAGGAGAAADFVIGEHNILQASETVIGVSRFSDFTELSAGVLDNVGTSPMRLIELLQTTGISSLKTQLLEAMSAALLTIKGFDSTAEGIDGSNITVQSGASTAGTAAGPGSDSGDASLVSLPGGDADTGIAGDSGNVTVQSSKGGDGTGVGSTGGNSGIVTVNSQQGGNGGAAGGNGGLANVQAGEGGDSADAGGVGGTGGNAQLVGGAGGADTEGGSGTGGDGGDVELRGGAAGAGNTPGAEGLIDLQSLTKNKTETGITAFATGGQANATQLAATNNKVTVVATIGDSVKLPVAQVGMVIIVQNAAANSLDLFPASGGEIDGAGVDTAVALAGGIFFRLVSYEAGKWDLN